MEFKEVRLETERLILRWFRADDFPAYLTMAQDPEVMKFLTGQPQTEIEAYKNMAAHIGHWYFRGYGTWAVEEKASGRVVGRIGLMNPVGWPGFECGWTLARASWGKGYATEGARRAMARAHSGHGFHLGQAQDCTVSRTYASHSKGHAGSTPHPRSIP